MTLAPAVVQMIAGISATLVALAAWLMKRIHTLRIAGLSGFCKAMNHAGRSAAQAIDSNSRLDSALDEIFTAESYLLHIYWNCADAAVCLQLRALYEDIDVLRDLLDY